MINHKKIIIMLCVLVLITLFAGPAQGAPDIIIIEDPNCQVVQYSVYDALPNSVLLDDMLNKLGTAFENGNRILGITSDNMVINLNSGLENGTGYTYYENSVTAGTIPEGTYIKPDFFAEIGEDGSLELTKTAQGDAEKDVGQWIGSGYHVIKNGFVDASLVANRNALDKAFLQQYLINVTNTKMDAQTHTSQKAIEIFQSINTNTEAEYSNAFFSGSVSADYAKASTTKRNETLIKHFAILRQSMVRYVPPANSDLNQHRDAGFIARIDHLGQSINTGLSDDSINNEIKDIFLDYGTHVITGYELGGRAEMNYAFSNQASIEKSDIEVAVKASYKGIGSNTSGENRTKIQNNIEQINTYSDLLIHFAGGQLNDMTTIEEFKANYAEWVASVKDNPTMLSIPSIDDNLVGIWELTGEPKDYSDSVNNKHGYGPIALKMYNCFLDLAKQRENELTGYDFSKTSNRDDYVMTKIDVCAGNTKAEALERVAWAQAQDKSNNIDCEYAIARLNPDGHGRYEIDANKGAGGLYLYLACRMERFRDENKNVNQEILDKAVVDIAITLGKKSNKMNYERVGVDLNASVGGDFVYLNYLTKAKDTAHKYQPLKEISGYYTKHFTVPYGWRNPSENHDLNRGCHGSTDIYLVIK